MCRAIPNVVVSCFLCVLSALCHGQQSSSIRVTVTDEQGALVLGGEVHVLEMPALVGLPVPSGTVTFKGVPPGTYRISTAYPGFRDELITGVVVVDGRTTELSVELKQAPPKASDFRIHQTIFTAHLFVKELDRIGQSSFCPDSIPDGAEWYRFIWVPTFAPPVFLRVDVDREGAATLLTYVWNGQGGYKWGKTTRSVRKLTREEEWDLFAALADIGFWGLPAAVQNPPNVITLDGTEWVIEGVKDGKCHVVTRYSSPLTSLFAKEFLGKVARVKPYSDPGE